MDRAELPWELPDAVWDSMVGPFLSRPASMERAAAEVDQIVSLTGVVPAARVLDLCCGMGRHALEMARRNFSVTGVDRTASFLDQARQQAQDEGCIPAAKFL